VAGACDGRGPGGGQAGATQGGAPAGEPRRVLEAMRFGWMIPLLVLLPGLPGRCPVL